MEVTTPKKTSTRKKESAILDTPISVSDKISEDTKSKTSKDVKKEKEESVEDMVKVSKWMDYLLHETDAPDSANTFPLKPKETVLIGKRPTPVTDGDGYVTLNGFFKIHKATFNIIRRNILKTENTLLLGPTGFGKTEMVYHMAKHLNVPITIFDMGTMTDPIMGIVGTNTIQVENGVTVSKFIKSRFSEVIQKPGIVLLDELSRSSPQANNLLFPCLDFRRELNMEYAFNDSEPIKIHPKCVFFATANIGSQYSGTSKIDRALLDRFILIEMDTLSPNQSKEILGSIYTNVSNVDIATIVSIYEQINKANADFTISFGLSFRHLKMITSLVQDGFTIYDSYHTLCKGLAGKEGLKSIESILSTKK